MSESASAAGSEQPVTVPPQVAAVFGAHLPDAARFADFLVTAGIERGLLGPREGARIWERHLLNCAAVAELFEPGARVVDVGSGAGLPGLAVALARPDLQVELVEPLLRRAEFLTEAVALLGLDGRVRVVRGRAEERVVRQQVSGAPWATARAVAPLDRLVRWCLPLVAAGGRLALLKGAAARAEVAEHRRALERLGVRAVRVVECGAGVLAEPTLVVLVERGA